jgi:putative methyltransferase (TIGR04325 family)
MKNILKQVLPPILINRLKVLFTNKFTGSYKSWEDALAHSKGYDSKDIFEKVKNSALKVNRGEAAFERDSVVFDKIEYSWPLLAALMWATAKENGRLDVLDFGGSLGSTYLQNRKFLEPIDDFSWNIVEQEHFVKCGKEIFESDRLKFF